MKIVKTKDNDFTVTVNNVNIHSKYSPSKEAEKFVSQKITDNGCVLVLGAGLGYIHKIVANKYPSLELKYKFLVLASPYCYLKVLL